MKALVKELQKVVSFKDTTSEGDLVLIVAQDPQFLAYALVTEIEKDPGRKKDWWCVHMQLLTIPPQKTVWTLREPQFTGQETFTMEGSERFMKAVSFAEHKDKGIPQPAVKDEQLKPGSQANPFHIVK